MYIHCTLQMYTTNAHCTLYITNSVPAARTPRKTSLERWRRGYTASLSLPVPGGGVLGYDPVIGWCVSRD